MFVNFEEHLNVPISNSPVFIEVGANKGQWQKIIKKKYADSNIYAFEPIPDITPKIDGVIVINKAIDIFDDQVREFFITKDNVTSSLLKLNQETLNGFIDFKDNNGLEHKVNDFQIESIIKVTTTRLDTFINISGLTNIHYIKIDTEGFDYNVLLSMENELEKIWAFEVETFIQKDWLFLGSNCTDDFINFSKKNNFTLVERFIHGRGNTHDLLFVNNKYLKK